MSPIMEGGTQELLLGLVELDGLFSYHPVPRLLLNTACSLRQGQCRIHFGGLFCDLRQFIAHPINQN